MGSPIIWNGPRALSLRPEIQVGPDAASNASVASGSVNPTLVAQNLTAGSIYIETGGNNRVWQKLDNGNTTNFKLIGGGPLSSDLNLLTLDSTGVPSNIDAATFESTLGGWYLYGSGTSIPTDMFGGSPTSTFAHDSVGPISGLGSALWTLTAGATRQGDGIAKEFTIPLAYRGARLAFVTRFVLSGNFVENDLLVYAYDVTNSQLITPFSAVKIIGSTGVAQAIIDLPSSCAQLRVGIHNNRSRTTLETIEIDDASVSPYVPAYGAAVSNDFDFSSNLTFSGFGIVTNVAARAWVEGQYLNVRGWFRTGTNAASTAQINISGYPIDTANMTVANRNVVGSWQRADLSGTNSLFSDGSSTTAIFFQQAGSAGATEFDKETGQQIANNNDSIGFSFRYPVAGRSSNVQLAESSTFRISSFLANGTRVTGAAPTRLGEYRSYIRGAGNLIYSETNGSPAAAPSATNGVLLYGGEAWGTADPNNEPSRYDIFVGRNKHVNLRFFASTGFTGYVSTDVWQSGAFAAGVQWHYDQTTGILTVIKFVNSGATSSQACGLDAAQGAVNNVYFDGVVSENALMVGAAPVRSEVRLDTYTSYGSTDTNVFRFTNSTITGTAYSVASSAGNGSVVTILEDGVYAFSGLVISASGTGQQCFISVGASGTELTTNDPQSNIAISKRIAAARTGAIAATTQTCTASGTMFIGAGSAIRMHGDTNVPGVASICQLRITKVSL